jgi:hypothetical protein
MVPRRTRAQTALDRAPAEELRPAIEKENAPPGLKRPAQAQITRRTPRRPRRTTTRDGGGQLSPPLARRRAYFERRAATDDDVDVDMLLPNIDTRQTQQLDKTKRKTNWQLQEPQHTFTSSASVSSPAPSTDAVELSNLPDDLVVAPDWVCDDSIPLHELAVRMRAALGYLRSIPNAHDNDETMSAPVPAAVRLNDLGSCLAVERFISHSCPLIRLFTACILAEILRIAAPDPPLPMAKLNPVAALFVEQVMPLARKDDPLAEYRLALLEHLALVKTFAVFCDDVDIVADVFAGAYAVVRPHHSSKLLDLLKDILVTMLDETEFINQVILDAVLAPLIPSRSYTPEAVQLAATVVNASQDMLQIPVCNFLNSALFQGRNRRGDISHRQAAQAEAEDIVEEERLGRPFGPSSNSSELMPDLEHLLVHINRIAPDILIYVIPNLERELHSKDVDRRRRCVHLLSTLFGQNIASCTLLEIPQTDANKRADMFTYPSLMADFIARIRDSDPKIRITLLGASESLMNLYPALHDELSNRVVERILDKVDDVRLAAIEAASRITPLTAHILQQISGRVLDRKIGVRKAAVQALVNSYCSSASCECDRIPQSLLHAYPVLRSISDFDTAEDIEFAILDGIHRPRANSPNRGSDSRTTSPSVSATTGASFRRVLGNTDKPALDVLRSMVQECFRMKEILTNIVNIRLTSKRPDAEQASFSKKVFHVKEAGNIDELALSLAAGLPPIRFGSETVQDVSRSFVAVKDLHVFKLLLRLINSDSSEEAASAAEEAVSRVGSKSHLGSFVQRVLSKSAYKMFVADNLEEALSVCSKMLSTKGCKTSSDSEMIAAESDREIVGALHYLDLAITYAASKFTAQSARTMSEYILHEWLPPRSASPCSSSISNAKQSDACNERILTMFLRATSHLRPELFGNSLDDLLKKCQQIATGDATFVSPSARKTCEPGGNGFKGDHWHPSSRACHAKWSTRTIISFGDVVLLRSELIKRIDDFNGDLESLICPITSLSQLAKHAGDVYKPIALESFDFAQALLSGLKNSVVLAFLSKSNPGTGRKIPSVSSSAVSETTGRAIKLFVYSTRFVEDEISNVVGLLVSIVVEQNGNVFQIPEGKLHYDSELSFADEIRLDSVAELSSICRLCACRGVIFLARSPLFYNKIRPSEFLSVVFCAQDEHPDVRLLFAKHVHLCLQRKRLPFRWIVSLVLMAVDPDKDNLDEVRSMCASLIRQRRRGFAQAVKRHGLSKSLHQLLPEAVVPVLIWVLANHPDIENDPEKDYAKHEKYLDFFFDRLLECTEYASVLHETLAQVAIAKDITKVKGNLVPSTSTSHIAIVAQTASALLTKKQAGRTWHVDQTYSLLLPSDLFVVSVRPLTADQIVPQPVE